MDKVRDLLRQSSKERIHDIARHVKENKHEALTSTASLMNFKQQQLQECFQDADVRFTPIMMENEKSMVDERVDDTTDEIQGLIRSLEQAP